MPDGNAQKMSKLYYFKTGKCMHSNYVNQRTASSATLMGKMEEIIEATRTCSNIRPNSYSSHSDVSFFVNFIQENKLAFSKERTVPNPQNEKSFHINESNKARFISILGRMAKAHDGISRQERLFLHQFWSEFHKST